MRRIVLSVGLVLVALLTLVRGADPGPVRELREIYFDYLQIYAPRPYQDLPVRVVDIDDASLAEIGQWPWPRELLAELVDNLAGYGAAVVVFDAIFAEPDRMSPSRLLSRLAHMNVPISEIDIDRLAGLDTDMMFANSVQTMPVVLGIAETTSEPTVPPASLAGFVQIGDRPGALAPRLRSPSEVLDPLRAAATGIGVISVSRESDSGTVRKVPLIWRTEAGFYPSLAIEALRVAFGTSTIVLQGNNTATGFLSSIRIGDLSIPTQPDGHLWVRYRQDDPALYVSAAAVLADEFNPEVQAALQGNIVLIGTSAAGLLDLRTSALRQTVPGVSIHAQVIEQVLLQEYLKRDDFIQGLEIVTFVVLGVIVLSVMTWFGPVASFSAGGATGLLVLVGSFVAFSELGVLFDVTYPLAGGFLAFSGLASYQFIVADRDKRLIRKSFAHYVAPSILDQIERSGHRLELGGENRTISVMFCDIRDFTPLSESMSAIDLVALLNDLFSDLGAQILNEKGTIDKFIGDAIMAFWNAPIRSDNHRCHAATAALRMRESLAAFNARTGRAPISVAIGISTGIACVGNIGSRDRFNYSAVGDTVNTAARIEAACRHVEYDVLTSDTVAKGIADLALLASGRLDLKGKSHRTETFILVGDAAMAESAEFKELARLHERAVLELARTGQISAELLNLCKSQAEALEPGLLGFYEKLPQRAKDFAEAAVETKLAVGANPG